MKKKNSLLGVILSICMLACVWNVNVHAATGSLSVSSTSGTVGSTVTVTGTVSASEAISAATVTLTYDPAGLQFVSGSQDVSGGAGSVTYFGDVMGQNKSSLSFNMTFKILKEGSFSVSGVVDAYTDADMQKISISGAGGTITGKAVTTENPPSQSNPTTPPGNSGNAGNTGDSGPTQNSKDTNNKLKSLQVSPGSLSPAFNANTTSYKVNVPGDTTEIIVSAGAQSSKANVSVSGNRNIKPGENTVKVVVTAESGATRVYTLTVICGEVTNNEEPQEEPEKIQINGTENTIYEEFTDEAIPTGFVRDKITYKGKEYEGLKHEKGEILLVNLQNEAGNAFYVFDEKTQEFYDFVQISFSEGRYIIPLTLDDTKVFADYEIATITLQDKTFDAWKIDEEYSIIRVMNHEGENVLYQYDSLDGTLQRYAGAIEGTVEEPEKTKETFFSILGKYHLYIIAGFGVVVLALIIALVCVVLKHRNKNKESYVEPVHVESRKQLKEVEKKPAKKKRKHDARRRKAIKRLQKQRMNEK